LSLDCEPQGIAINFRQLRYFAKIVEAGNITRAAEQLYVAQPALGLQIRTLEQDLGVPLLIRHSRGVTPTQAGQLLYERACDILRSVEDARKAVSGFSSPGHESVAVGLTPSVMHLAGQWMLVGAREAMPNVQMSVVEEMSYVLVDALEREEIDVAFAYSVPERPGLVRLPILEEELIFVSVPDSGDADKPIEFEEALRRPLALARDRDVLRSVIVSAAEERALVPNIAYEASSIVAMKKLVASGAAASIMPFGSAADELDRGVLQSRRIVNPPLRRTLYLVRASRRGRLNNEKVFLEFARTALLRMADALGPLVRKLPGIESEFPALL